MAMVERPGPLSLSRQCQLLGLNRAALYYQPAPVDAYELELMALLDRFADNIFVERLWRCLKYEEVYLKAYDNVAQARQGIAAYFEFSTTNACIRRSVTAPRASSWRRVWE